MTSQVFDLFLHLDKHLNAFAADHRVGVYGVLCCILFCETGLVVTPFLPGDSLLFAVGALAASVGSPISLPLVLLLMCLSVNLGDITNYSIGRRAGPHVFSREGSLLLNKRHLAEAHAFYERHGRKTLILARFVPIIRTFAPFVAGIGDMPFARFIGFSVSGGLLWVVALTLCGYFFNRIEVVRTHFQVVVLVIVFISVLPAAWHALRAQQGRRGFKVASAAETTAP